MTLGLTEAQFWEYTPRHVLTLWHYHIAAESRMDRRFAVLYTMYANAHRDDKKHPKPFAIEDFLPRSKPIPERRQSAEDMISICEVITESFKQRPNGHA